MKHVKSNSRELLLAKRKKDTEMKEEKKILEYIQRLPDEMINEIRPYLCGAAKEIIEKEMARKLRIYYCKMLYQLPRWHFSEMLDKISKKDLIRFVLEGSIRKYPELVKEFRIYLEDTTLKGITMIETWRRDEITEDDSIITFCISEDIRKFLPTKVDHLGLQEIKSYIHLYKSLEYIVKMKS